MDPARIQRALDGLIYLPLLKGRSATEPPETEPDAPQPHAGARQCRPWDRGDLLRRLQSFQPATWFCKPACAGPVACARRGWANTSLDQLTCEVRSVVSLPLCCYEALHTGADMCSSACPANYSPDHGLLQTCGAKLSFVLPPRMPLQDVEKARSSWLQFDCMYVHTVSHT